nr:reverse transcriptase domain-containing protein [Tanacetum cinerariifolium]
MTMKFTIIRAPSHYNVILKRPGLKTLRSIPSIVHSMMKFPTPREITTLVARATIIFECRMLEKKQMLNQKVEKCIDPEGKEKEEAKEVSLTEEMLVNLVFPDQLVTISGKRPKEYKGRLKAFLKKNHDKLGSGERIFKMAQSEDRPTNQVKEYPRKGQNQIKTGQKQEAWRSQEKSKALTVDRARKTEQNAKRMT